MSEEPKDAESLPDIEASARTAPGAEINELLSYAMVDLEFGLNVLESDTNISRKDREAAQEGLESACKNVLAVAEIIRSESRFWDIERESQEVVLTSEEENNASRGEEKVDSLEILLIDDEFRMGRVFQRILSDRAELMMATTISEAWRLLDLQAFDVVFCDVHLPGVSGVDFFRELQTQNPKQAARVIFITGGLYSEESQKLIDEVENPVVYKPFDFAAIESALAMILV